MAQPTQTGTEQASHEAHSAAFPPFDGTTFASQLIWIALTFGVLYLLMSRVTLPRIEGVLKNRHSKIAGDLAEAQRLRTESEEAMQAYEKALHDARANAQAIGQKTREDSAAEFDTRRKALEADLNAKIASAEETIRTSTAAAMTSVRGIAADAATAIVERLTGTTPAPSEVIAALDRAAA
jgi:F-type H+-transporting ATPase subunit b